MSLILYKYNNIKPGYLIEEVCSDIYNLDASPYDTIDSILERISVLSDTSLHFLFHLDLTDSQKIIPDRIGFRKKMNALGIPVYNDQITSISKSFIQRSLKEMRASYSLAEKRGDEEEPVLVKTNRNAGGSAERRISETDRVALGIEVQPVKKGPTKGYLKLKRKEVASEIWDDPAFVVERYISNERNAFLRGYLLLDKIVISSATEDTLIKRMDRACNRVNYLFPFDAISSDMKFPEYIVKAFHLMVDFSHYVQMNYGCIDFVLDQNYTPYIVDMNVTPHWGEEYAPEVLDYLKIVANKIK